MDESAPALCVSGSTVYTCMLNKRGGVEADLTVSRLEAGAANLPLAPQSDGQQHLYLHHSGQSLGSTFIQIRIDVIG